MTGFLLDANLSPKIAKFLSNDLQLDVKSLHRVGLATLPDHAVIRLAQQERRVIVTLDRDFAEYFQRSTRPAVGIIYLDLPGAYRFIPAIIQILYTFFTEHSSGIELDRCLVILTEETVRIVRSMEESP